MSGRRQSPCRATPPPAPRRTFRLEQLEERSLFAAGVATTIDLPEVQVDPTRYVDGHILVRFRTPAAAAALPGTSLGPAIPLVTGGFQVDLAAGTTVDEAVQAYRHSAAVVWAEPDYQLVNSWVPNDPRFPEQYNFNNTGQAGGTAGADIRAVSAWGVTVGSKRLPVAVMDSGIDYTHPDLYLNIWINQGEIPATRRAKLTDVDGDRTITFYDLNNPINIGPGKITDLNKNGYIDGGDLLKPMDRTATGADAGTGGWADGASQDGDRYVDDLVGWNSNADTNNPYDDYGHGTHLAGIIGAIGNNGVGVAGVNWQVSLVPVKFFNANGAGSVLQFIDGLDYALAKGIKISNNSWNDSGYTPVLYDAVKRAQAAGHIFVAAAGNNGRNTDTAPAYPAGFDLDNVVAVAAVTRTGALAGFSNYGAASVDLAAPGVDVLSTTPNKGYNIRSGTSMATPQVTGVIALVWGLRPEWTYRQVIAWVMQTATPTAALNGKVMAGLLNANAAVRVPPRGTVMPTSFAPRTATTAAVAQAAATLKPSAILSGVATPSSAPTLTPTQAQTPPLSRSQVLDLLFAVAAYRPTRRGAPSWDSDDLP